ARIYQLPWRRGRDMAFCRACAASREGIECPLLTQSGCRIGRQIIAFAGLPHFSQLKPGKDTTLVIMLICCGGRRALSSHSICGGRAFASYAARSVWKPPVL